MLVQDTKFLVVDDHFLLRQMVVALLKNTGAIKIDTAADGIIALGMLEEARASGAPYNVMFLDWSMPNMNGHDMLVELRADRQFDNLAVVMLTAESEDVNIVKILQAGATAYLSKPIDAETLTNKLDDLKNWFNRQPAVQP